MLGGFCSSHGIDISNTLTCLSMPLLGPRTFSAPQPMCLSLRFESPLEVSAASLVAFQALYVLAVSRQVYECCRNFYVSTLMSFYVGHVWRYSRLYSPLTVKPRDKANSHAELSTPTMYSWCLAPAMPAHLLVCTMEPAKQMVLMKSLSLPSNIGDGEVDRLRQLLPPFSLCDLLTSTSLLQRRYLYWCM